MEQIANNNLNTKPYPAEPKYGTEDFRIHRAILEAKEALVNQIGIEDEDWRAQALCAQFDPEIYYPRVGQSAKLAKMICRECPVKEKCEEVGVFEQMGVWAGESEMQRRKSRRQKLKEAG